MSDITRILSQFDRGESRAAEQLLPLVYDELRKLAAARLAHEKPGQTLQATALVHEAYLRLVGKSGDRGQGTGDRQNAQINENLSPGSCSLSPVSYESRGHFFAAAAEAMRRILVERARRRGALKRGGQAEQIELHEGLLASEDRDEELLAVHTALDRLEQHDPQAAQLVKLRYFVGMQHQEAADTLGISRRAADRLWLLAKSWLHRELKS
jgi:RNA polymerase sigma factor (sigma-70 family)